MIKLSGVQYIEFGSVNHTSVYEMEGVINDNTAAAVYVVLIIAYNMECCHLSLS